MSAQGYPARDGIGGGRSRLWRAARAYARHGLPVAPTKPKSKAPFLCAGGFRAATTNLAQIDAWWRRTPMANIALACSEESGLVALDVDDRDALDHLLRHGELPTTPTQISGSGGVHYLFRRPPWFPFRSRVCGVEIKHVGSIHVAPSVHPSDAIYRWEMGLRPLVDLPIAPMPEWLLEMARQDPEPLPDEPDPHRSAAAVDRARRYLQAMDPAISGQGDVATFRAAVALVRGFGLDDETALVLLQEYNARCDPPWSRTELAHKIRSARRRGRRSWGYLLGGEQRRSA